MFSIYPVFLELKATYEISYLNKLEIIGLDPFFATGKLLRSDKESMNVFRFT